MDLSAALLLASFMLSRVGMFVFTRSMTRDSFGSAEGASRIIFSANEEHTTNDLTVSDAEIWLIRLTSASCAHHDNTTSTHSTRNNP
jgi:hypothetical protein